MPTSDTARGWDLQSRLEYIVVLAFTTVIASLPRRLAVALGAATGGCLYWVALPLRRTALANLERAFPDRPDAERRRILRASCRNLGRVGAEFCHLPRLRAADVGDLVTFPDVPAWEQVLRERDERGLIVVTAHFGNWELLAYAHGLLGHPVTLVHKPMRNRFVDRLVMQVRERAGTQPIAKRAAARRALRVLRDRGILVIPSDQNQPRREGIFVDFFGIPACTNAGAARLARHTGAALRPVFLVREGETGRHRVEILPEIERADTGDVHEDVRVTTQRCSDAIESMLRRYPEQWIWFHRRWRTRPPGEPRRDD